MKPGYANVMATLAVFIALGGTSWAAVKITGANVKNGSLTGKDIRDRSIAPRDLKKKVTGKRGPAGAPGPRGAVGPAGPQGERGPSLSTFVRGGAILDGNLPEHVAKLELPAGNWMLAASATMSNLTTAQVTADCELRVGPDESDLDTFTGTGDLLLRGEFGKSTEVISLNHGITMFSPGVLVLNCRSEPAEVRVTNAVITAIESAELTDQTDESQFPN